jgi:hypothetical protein
MSLETIGEPVVRKKRIVYGDWFKPMKEANLETIATPYCIDTGLFMNDYALER